MARTAPIEAASVAETAALYDVHATRRVGPYLGGLWARRQYMWSVSTGELRARQMTSVLGNLWHLLNPTLQIAVYYVIFGLLLQVNRGVDNFIAFLTVGIFVFGFTQRSTTSGAKSVVSNRGLMMSMSFPRALLPTTSTLTETLVTIPPVFVMFAVALMTGEVPRWQWVLIVPLLLVQLVMNLGLAMIAARATNHVRDIQQVLPFIFRLLLYGSGVIFNTEAYASSSWSWVFYANPIYCVITIARTFVIGGEFPPILLLSLCSWAVGLLVVGFFWFRAGEMEYGRD